MFEQLKKYTMLSFIMSKYYNAVLNKKNTLWSLKSNLIDCLTWFWKKGWTNFDMPVEANAALGPGFRSGRGQFDSL
jgi:hypothetical protein